MVVFVVEVIGFCLGFLVFFFFGVVKHILFLKKMRHDSGMKEQNVVFIIGRAACSELIVYPVLHDFFLTSFMFHSN